MMAKSRKKKKARKAAKRRPAKTSKRKVKKAARRKVKRAAKPKSEGIIGTLVGTAEDAAALRRRLVGRDSFED